LLTHRQTDKSTDNKDRLKPGKALVCMLSVSYGCFQVIDKRLIDGADEYLQVMDLCTVIMQQICNAS